MPPKMSGFTTMRANRSGSAKRMELAKKKLSRAWRLGGVLDLDLYPEISQAFEQPLGSALDVALVEVLWL